MGITRTGLQGRYKHGYLELDSHADVAVLGANCRVFQETNKTVQVSGYDPALGTVERKIVSGCFAYDDPDDGECKILIIHQGLYVPTMPNSLIPPFQMRDNDIIVNDCPKKQVSQPNADHHAIIVQREKDGLPLRIPLMLKGTISAFPVRWPTDAEFVNNELERFELTYETPDWDHGDPDHEREEAAANDQAQVEEREATGVSVTSISLAQGDISCYDSCCPDRARISGISNTLLPDTLCDAMKEHCHVSTIYAPKARTAVGITAEQLAHNWKIPLARARQTIEVTTQRGIRTRPYDIVRRFKTNDRLLRYNRLPVTMYTDTIAVPGKGHSVRGNSFAQVFAVPPAWIKVYAMATKGDAPHALSQLLRDVGVPEKMVMDGSKEQLGHRFRNQCRDAGCKTQTTEPYSPWSNRAELAIRELKKATRRRMVSSGAPRRLWDDCIELEADIMSHTARDEYAFQGQTPQAILMGHASDISKYAEFAFYQWVMWYDSQAPFPEPRNTLGRYLGPTRDEGMAMSAKLLKSNGNTTFRSTFNALTEDQMKQPSMIKRMEAFDLAVNKKIGQGLGELHEFRPERTIDFVPYVEDDVNPAHTIPDRDDIDASTYDPYVGAEVLLPYNGQDLTAKVKARKRDANGDLIGHAADNPILDTRQYDVEFPDGNEATYSANVIAQNMLSQCDSEGRQYLLVKHVLDHAKVDGEALEGNNAYVTVNGRRSRIKTTRGWKFCIEWTDGTTSWLPLATLKEQIPVEIAEYAVTNGIDDEPAFAWWVHWTLKKRDGIISAVNKRYWKRTHKFGIQLPHSVDEATKLDKANGDTKWTDAINKEMANVMVAFKMIGKGKVAPPGHQMIKCHIIFDVKMDNFARKARMVAGGHTTETPASLTYASVVSRDSIRIALTMAALHSLEVKAGDIQNAYLTAPCSEKIATICGPEFGKEYEGQTAIIVRALYGLKSSGAAFRNHLAACMRALGYTSCPADPDVWMRPEVRDDGFLYYAYVLLYVDDALVINHNGMKALLEINAHFTMKKESMGDPDTYLGCKMSLHVLQNGVQAWLQSPSKYIQEAVRNAETYFSKEFNMPFARKVTSPFTPHYRPEMDASAELDEGHSARYQSDIGILRWIVEIGRIDIITEVSLLSSHLALPRMGHLMQVWHIYAFLRSRHNGCLIFDPTYPEINESSFIRGDTWKEFYGKPKEPMPPNAPRPRGKEVQIRVYVDSDHAGEEQTRRSRTGFLIYVNKALVLWYSKRQGTIESSVFGAEFVAMKNATEAARGLRYKLRMMGIAVNDPNYIYGDNMSVIHNTQRPESTLKKKSISICYHFMRESVAMGESLTAHIRSEDNPADICTKVMTGGMKRDRLTAMILSFSSNIAEVASTSVRKLKRIRRTKR